MRPHRPTAAFFLAFALLGCAPALEPANNGTDDASTPGSPVNPSPRTNDASGGSGGSGGSDAAGPAAPTPIPVPTSPAMLQVPDAVSVVFSELMYHPVDETTDAEEHEFIEIYNRGTKAVDLAGWTLASDKGALRFTFPAGAVIAPRQYRVIARSRKALAAVARYGLTEGELLGDYTGELDNGVFTVSLRDAAGKVIEAVKVSDSFPWPVSADALGVSDEWLPADQRPIEKHRYLGRSLERISTDSVAGTPANWEASALDGATPGKPSSVIGAVLPVAEQVSATAEGTDLPIIRSTQKIAFRARFSAFAPVTGVELEYFVDDIVATGEPTMKAPMTAGAEGLWSATLGPFKDNTLVRWRVRATREGRAAVLAPRGTDPLAWYTAFVSPVVFVKTGVESKERTYHLWITPADWTVIEKAIAPGRASGPGGCNVNPDWDRTVPATLIADGRAFDVRVRYQGSRYQRTNGMSINNFAAPKPVTADGKLRALSWRIKFPRYDRLDGRQGLTLNKMNQGCPGAVSYVESKLLERAGMPTYQVRFARLHVNGAYYHYMAEPEDIDERILERTWPNEPVGDLFKNDGSGGDEGPIARGDFKPIGGPNGSCPQHTVAQRYRVTYPRKTHEHRPYDDIVSLITDLRAAKSKDPAAVRQYFLDRWDVNLLAAAFAVRNFSGVWDDTFHNFFPYKRAANGKWYLIQQDFEADFGIGKLGVTGIGTLGSWNPAQTLYIGWNSPDVRISKGCELPEGMQAGCNGLGFSALKDAFIGAFRAELDEKYRELVRKGVLSGPAVQALVEEGVGKFSLEDWNASPAGKSCDVNRGHDMMRAWARDRAATVTQKLMP